MAPQILVFGLPRTGTQSILDALEILGFEKTYHMRNVQRQGNIEDWITLLDQKFSSSSNGKIDMQRLDRIIEGFDATADFPSAIFAVELMQLYPNAKIILTPRDEDSWVTSMSTTLIRSHNSPDADRTRPMAPLADKYHRYCWNDDFDNYGRQFYRDYFAEVKRVAADHQVLEYHPSYGWEPLCRFLDKLAPDVGFPRKDEVRERARVRES
jgi:hypothetical protein